MQQLAAGFHETDMALMKTWQYLLTADKCKHDGKIVIKPNMCSRSANIRLALELRSHLSDVPFPRCIACFPVTLPNISLIALCLGCKSAHTINDSVPGNLYLLIPVRQGHRGSTCVSAKNVSCHVDSLVLDSTQTRGSTCTDKPAMVRRTG